MVRLQRASGTIRMVMRSSNNDCDGEVLAQHDGSNKYFYMHDRLGKRWGGGSLEWFPHWRDVPKISESDLTETAIITRDGMDMLMNDYKAIYGGY